jgi:hypothetical protein
MIQRNLYRQDSIIAQQAKTGCWPPAMSLRRLGKSLVVGRQRWIYAAFCSCLLSMNRLYSALESLLYSPIMKRLASRV